MDNLIDRFGKMTLGRFTIKVIGGKSYAKRFKYEYGLYDGDYLIGKHTNLEKLKELARQKQKEKE